MFSFQMHSYFAPRSNRDFFCITIKYTTKMSRSRSINSLQNGLILALTKLETCAKNKLNVVKMIIFFYDRVENIEGKGEK